LFRVLRPSLSRRPGFSAAITQHKYGSRRSGSRICVALDEQIQIGIHRVADVGGYAAEVDAFDDFFFFDAPRLLYKYLLKDP